MFPFPGGSATDSGLPTSGRRRMPPDPSSGPQHPDLPAEPGLETGPPWILPPSSDAAIGLLWRSVRERRVESPSRSVRRRLQPPAKRFRSFREQPNHSRQRRNPRSAASCPHGQGGDATSTPWPLRCAARAVDRPACLVRNQTIRLPVRRSMKRSRRFRLMGLVVESRFISFGISRIVSDDNRLFPDVETIASHERSMRGLRDQCCFIRENLRSATWRTGPGSHEPLVFRCLLRQADRGPQ